MDQIINYLLNHRVEAVAIVIAVVSEFMALNPNWQYNGILHALIDVLKRLYPTAAMLALFFFGLLFLSLTGCASLQDAGTAHYKLTPYTGADGKERCCSMEVINGKNIGSVKARIKGPDYDISLEEQGVDAAHSQAIAAGTVEATMGQVAPLIKALTVAPVK